MACGRRSGRAACATNREGVAVAIAAGCGESASALLSMPVVAWRQPVLRSTLGSAMAAACCGASDCTREASSFGTSAAFGRSRAGGQLRQSLFERVLHQLGIIGGEPVLGGQRCLCPVGCAIRRVTAVISSRSRSRRAADSQADPGSRRARAFAPAPAVARLRGGSCSSRRARRHDPRLAVAVPWRLQRSSLPFPRAPAGGGARRDRAHRGRPRRQCRPG